MQNDTFEFSKLEILQIQRYHFSYKYYVTLRQKLKDMISKNNIQMCKLKNGTNKYYTTLRLELIKSAIFNINI